MVGRMDLKKCAHLFLGGGAGGGVAVVRTKMFSVFLREDGWRSQAEGGDGVLGDVWCHLVGSYESFPPIGYPIPHKSLAEDWGFREAWQNRCIKQEQTSHNFLFCLSCQGVGRGGACLHGTASVHISSADNGRSDTLFLQPLHPPLPEMSSQLVAHIT